jgi:hypothetical protein
MARPKKSVRDDQPDTDPPEQTAERERELVGLDGVESACREILSDIQKGFANQWDRSNQILDFWDIYHCQLGPKQFYSGNSKIFLPYVHDAVNARKTRFVNQVFPQSGKHVEVTASEDRPQGLQSLLEFYIRKSKLRTKVLPALCRNGDVEGQYTIMMHWVKNKRHVAARVKRAKKIDDMMMEGDEEFDDIEEQVIEHYYPEVEVIPDADLLILPVNAESIEGALQDGGNVTVVRRWSKTKIHKMAAEGEIDQDKADDLLDTMSRREKNQIPDKKDSIVNALGVQTKGGKAPALVFMTWVMLDIEDERRLCRVYFSADEIVLSVKLCPYWCDKPNILSAPVEKVEGCFKGAPKIKFVETIQYQANDAINEGMDAAAYALLPIVMTDPMRNPRTGSMVLNVGAVWEVDPKSTQFAQFPQLWKEAVQIAQAAKDQILQTMGVNPAMMPQQAMGAGKKPNQAQIANEQMVDILTTADAVTTLEGEILTPLLQYFIYLDHQFRDTMMTVRAFGKPGIAMAMEQIEPIQMDRRFEFRWFGVEAARNAQQMQMQMAGLNALRSIPPQLYPGFELQLAPVIQQWVENLFGPRVAMEVFRDVKAKLTLEPKFENELLMAGFDLPAQPMDNDQEHMKAHAEAMQSAGDFAGSFRTHLMRHQMQMQQRQQAMQAQQQQIMMGAQQAQPPGGGGGGPRPGANSKGPRSQGPAGMVPHDRLPNAPPRQRGMG